jgi:hypothetical protein
VTIFPADADDLRLPADGRQWREIMVAAVDDDQFPRQTRPTSTSGAAWVRQQPRQVAPCKRRRRWDNATHVVVVVVPFAVALSIQFHSV